MIECGVIKVSVVGCTNEYVARDAGARAEDSLIGWSLTDDRNSVLDGSWRE